MFQRVMFGELDNPKNQTLKDLNVRELTIMAPLVALIFFMGVYPTPFLDKMAPAIDRLVQQGKQKQVAVVVQPQMPMGNMDNTLPPAMNK
jgi:NADH-quinone oxidoreductase subunit M